RPLIRSRRVLNRLLYGASNVCAGEARSHLDPHEALKRTASAVIERPTVPEHFGCRLPCAHDRPRARAVLGNAVRGGDASIVGDINGSSDANALTPTFVVGSDPSRT